MGFFGQHSQTYIPTDFGGLDLVPFEEFCVGNLRPNWAVFDSRDVGNCAIPAQGNPKLEIGEEPVWLRLGLSRQ